MRIVGLDWGSSSLKAVEIDSAFGRYEIHDHREVEFTEGLDPAEAVRQLLSSFSKNPHRIVTALRSSLVTTRNLHLPTRDRKAIQAAVPFQLEEELPFSIDDMLYDSSMLSQSGQQSDVHVATTLKRHVAAEISRWGDLGCDPDVISTEGWALRTLVNRSFSSVEQDHPILLIQIGAKTTLLYLHWRGFPMVCREIRWGGNALTQHLASTLGLNLDQAERTKRNPSILQESHPQSLVDLLIPALEPLQREIKHMDLVCKGVTHENLQSIHLLGGGSLVQGLPDTIHRLVGIPASRLRALSALSPSGVSFAETNDARLGMAASLAMTLVGPDKNLAINLRRGEFTKLNRGREFNFSNLAKPLAAMSTAAACFFLSTAVQTSHYRGQLEERDTQLKRAMSAFFGSVSNSAIRTYLGNPESLRSAIQKELDKNRELARMYGPNPASPHQLLKNLSNAVRKDVVVDLMKFQMSAATTGNTIELSFIAADRGAAEQLSQQLSPKLIDSAPPVVEEIPASGKEPRKFRISFKGSVGPGGFSRE